MIFKILILSFTENVLEHDKLYKKTCASSNSLSPDSIFTIIFSFLSKGIQIWYSL